MSKNHLRIIFFGTPEFATTILDKLVTSRHEVVAVVTAVDKPAGRGRKLNESHVKQYAKSNGIKVLQPKNLKSPDFVKDLRSFNADLQVIVAFRMLPKVVWEMPPLGTFNLHASLLPQYRGAAPINWAVINQEKQSGVTTFFIDEKIDTGAIIEARSVDLEQDETAGTLYEKLMYLGADLTLATVESITDGTAKTRVQEHDSELNEAPKLDKSNTQIDFTRTADEVDALVRGLYPFPVAKATLINDQKLTCKIYKTAVFNKDHNMTPGSIVIDGKKMLVACGSKMIEILEMQLPNKKRMSIPDLLNGYEFFPNARFDASLQEN
jgi:methionyl-tRNA formyltransferase